MGGGKKEPTVTRAPTKTAGQTQFLESLLGMMKNYMGPGAFGQMPTLGERYGGGRPAPGTTAGATPGGGGKGGTAPSRMSPGGGMLRRKEPPMSPEQRQAIMEKYKATGELPEGTQVGRMTPLTPTPGTSRPSPLDELLTGPIVEPFREGMTGNYPRRRRG